jgi:hypothetical protein
VRGFHQGQGYQSVTPAKGRIYVSNRFSASRNSLAPRLGPCICLNEHLFFGLAEARHLIEAWRQDYNQLRPHSSLGALAPAEYANRQGGGPPDQAQGSAARPLAPPPHLGQVNQLRTLLINAPMLGCRPPRGNYQ